MIQSINLFKKEVALIWNDNSTTLIKNYKLRQLCPCAFCSGETDVLGKKYGGEKQAIDPNIFIVKYETIGYYGLQFLFSDGHKDGIYTFDLLKKYDKN